MKQNLFSLIIALILLLVPALAAQNVLKANPVFVSNYTAIPISCGQTLTGNITSPTQEDAYTFEGNAGEAVIVSAVGTSGTLCARADLYSPSGTFIGSNSCNSGSASLPLPTNGIYTIIVYDLGKNDIGTYGVNLQFVTGRCGTPIICGETKNGNITNLAQHDTYTFTGNTSEAVVISAVGTAGTICARADLYSPSGTFIGSNSCNSGSASFPLPANGTYTILVYDLGNNDTGTYGVNLQFVTGQCGMPIACGETKNGNVTNKAQHDTYSFTGNTGEAVIISAVGTAGTICARADLYSPSGTFIGSNSCNSGSASFPLPANGTYTILVYDLGNNDTGTYGVNLQFVTGRCGTLTACGETKNGNVTNKAQHDTYSFTGNMGEAVIISAVGTAGTICARADLYSPSGTFIGSNSCNSGSASFPLPANGTYTILVYDLGNNDTGTYGVNLQFVTGRCGTLIACGETKNGNVTNKAQHDTYSFTGNTSEAVVISAVGTAGTICARADLYSPSGTFIGSNSCNSGSASFPLPANGTYTILVYDLGNNDIGTYQVNLSCTTTLVDSPVMEKLPLYYELGQNYPNPFNPSTTIAFSLPRSSHVTLKVLDLMGKEITVLMDKKLVAGRYEVLWNARDEKSGVYFYQLRAGEFVTTKKLTLMR